ncbi:MAG: DUF3999 domain-containing protein [Acidobacteriota bacterium]|nr:DUF3999 domain-containing protein [Acidobacteriota bacterium]
MRPALICAAIVTVTFIALPSAQQAPADRFRFERTIVTSGSGPRRLAIDVPLLIGAEPYLARDPRMPGDRPPAASGLSDLRLFDQSGSPVPHLLLQAPARQPQWSGGAVLPLARTDKTSGFEADFHAAETVDAIRVSGLPVPFLKRCTLEASGDRAHWTLLAGEASLFDLPEEGLRQTELRFPPGSFRYLRVTWDDRNSGRVPMPMAVEARRVPGIVPPPSLTVRLAAERRPSEPGRSRYRITLPAARLPIVALDVIIAGDGHVFRQATVSESRLSGMDLQPAELGRARLIQIVRDGSSAGALRIPIAPPVEAELDLVIDDGANAPLDVSGVTAVFTELPWIYFEAPVGQTIARYGNPSAVRPAYDLEAIRDSVNIATVKDASWGEVRPIVEREHTSPPAAALLPVTGSVVDADLFAFRRTIPDGPSGLAALVLDAAALAHSRGPGARFADVRILDASNRQIPYIIERRDEPIAIPLAPETAEPNVTERREAARSNRSSYRLRLPYANLPSSRLVIETSARTFQRVIQLAVERPPDRRRRDAWLEPIVATTWAHVDRDEAAPALLLPVGQMDATQLWLSVDEGDNSALPLTGVRLLLPSYRLRFYRPARSALRLVYGRSDLPAPQYDLALLAPQVMGVEAREVTPAAESGSNTATGQVFISPRGFWLFLSLAVLVLIGLIVRLTRKSP